MKKLIPLFFCLAMLVSGSAQAASLSISNNDFGDVYIPTDVSSMSTVGLKSSGGSIMINSITIVGANADEFTVDDMGDECSGQSVNPPCDIAMTFTPTGFGERSASLVVNAPTDENADGDGNVTFELTGVGLGCGDAIITSPEETCDFENPDDVDCCDDTCTMVISGQEGEACNSAGGCQTGGTCNADGNCEGPFTPADDGTECSTNDACISGETCLTGACQGGSEVICPAPAECFESAGCDSIEGCLETPSAAGTSCADGEGTCDGSGNCSVPSPSPSPSPSPTPPSDGGGCSFTGLASSGASGFALFGLVGVILGWIRFKRS